MKGRNHLYFWLFVVGYCLFSNHSKLSIFNLQEAVIAKEANKTILDNLASASDPNSNYKKELLRVELNMPEVRDEDIMKSELRKMIEQIRSIDVGISKQTPEPVVIPDDVPKSEPNEVVVKKEVEKKQEMKVVEDKKSSNGMVTRQTLEILKKFSQDPNSMENPFELGETLFLSGYNTEAVIFYRQAYKRINPGKADSAQDRAWILFQIGNCLRDTDKPEAVKAYDQLIKEYPDSPWKRLAEVRKLLINWYLKEEPDKLIEERFKVG
jgi:tetratricopeptide (TPR) repeat protein